MKNHIIKFSVLVSLIFLSTCKTERTNTKEDDSSIEGSFYLGQKPPGLIPEVFAPSIVSINGRYESTISFSPDNGGYVLLSLIVGKVSGMPFHKFMETNIFKPLGMNNTLVYDESAPKIENRAVGYNQSGDLDDYEIFTTGAGGMYSTVDDLHLWNQALYSEKLIPKSTLEEAFTSATLNNGESTNYGYG